VLTAPEEMDRDKIMVKTLAVSGGSKVQEEQVR